MDIKATPKFTTGIFTNIDFTYGDIIYNRSVLTADWEIDSQAIIAQVCKYLDEISEPVITPLIAIDIVMTKDEVDAKLAELKTMEEAKKGEDDGLNENVGRST